MIELDEAVGRMTNFSDHLLSNDAAPADVVMIDGSKSYSYGQLRAAVVSLAAKLDSISDPGDRVGIVSRNSFFWVASYLATMYAGRVAVPFAITTTPAEARRQAEWVGASAFFVDRTLRGRFTNLLEGATVFGDETLETDHGESWEPTEVPPNTTGVLQLTSGTTAAPKAVEVTHGNLQANTASIIEYLNLEPSDRMLVVLPFTYCFGASLLHTHLRTGASLVLCHTLTFPETVIDALNEHRCTGFAGVPSTYQLLLRASSLPNCAVPSLRHMQQAGGRLAPALVNRIVASQPQARVFVMYGQTEATSRLSYLPPDQLERRSGSIGRGIPGVCLTVLDEDGREVSPGSVGEIVAGGANVTKGYWNDSVATAEKFRNGRLFTGDLATVDDDGYIYIVDRSSDFIKSWGVRVSSREIEDAAVTVPGVAAAAAIGIPDEVAGEAIILFVVAGDGELRADDVLAELRIRLAKHMVPHAVRLVADLPLNANGKVVRSQLRTMASADQTNFETTGAECVQ